MFFITQQVIGNQCIHQHGFTRVVSIRHSPNCVPSDMTLPYKFMNRCVISCKVFRWWKYWNWSELWILVSAVNVLIEERKQFQQKHDVSPSRKIIKSATWRSFYQHFDDSSSRSIYFLLSLGYQQFDTANVTLFVNLRITPVLYHTYKLAFQKLASIWFRC